MSLSPEQLARRKLGLGSSEIGAIAGVNPYASQHSVWASKMGLVEDAPTHATRVGDKIEPVIAELYAEDTGSTLVNAYTLAHATESWMLATPDRFVVAPGLTPANPERVHDVAERIVEIKCVGARTVYQWSLEADGVPEWYQCQTQWQMHVSGVHACDVAALLGGTEFRIYRLTYDADIGAALEAIGRRFWQDHVLTGKPPAADGSSHARDMLAKLYPRNKKPAMVAPPAAEEWATKLREARALVKAGTATQLEAENKLKELLADSEAMAAPTWRCTWKTSKSGTRPFIFKTQEGEAA